MRVVTCLVVVLMTMSVAAADTATYVDIINAGDDKAMLAFVKESYDGAMLQRLPASFLAAAHLPEGWLAPEVAAQIQIRHLLTHTSGLGDYFQSLYRQHEQELFRNLEDYKILVADAAPAFEPGSRFAYSNTGMLLAGVIVEHVSGMEYFAYLEKHVFGPAGMTDTGAWDKACRASSPPTHWRQTYDPRT